MPDAGKVDAWHDAAVGDRAAAVRRYLVALKGARPPNAGSSTRVSTSGTDIFAVRDVTWVNLQYDECERELHDAEQRFGVKIHRWDWLDLMNDFDEVAALTVNLDLVVAPFNAVAMLSGALGVRTVTMGNRYGWSELGTGTVPWLPVARARAAHA